MHKTTWPASCETRIQVKKQQLELDMEQLTGSKLGTDKGGPQSLGEATAIHVNECQRPAFGLLLTPGQHKQAGHSLSKASWEMLVQEP